MTTDEERREVARRLRCDLKNARSRGYYCNDSEAVRYICDILGLRCSRCTHPFAGLDALADLIEPPHQCPYYDSLRHRCSFHDVPAVDRDAERTWHDFADELPPAKKPVLCKGRNGALYVGKPVTFAGGERTREVWVPRGDQYRKPEKWMEIDDDHR